MHEEMKIEDGLEKKQEKLTKNGTAKTSLILGIISLALSWVLVINNIAAIVAIVGFVFGIVGLVQLAKASGKLGYVITAVILNVAAFFIVIATQFVYLDMLTTLYDGPQAISADAPVQELKVGETAHLANGLDITVDDVKRGINYRDNDVKLMSVRVTIKNDSDEQRYFSPSDWESINEDGILSRYGFYADYDNRLESGSFIPGGKVSGHLYFKDDAVKLAYVTGHDHRIAATWDLN